MKLRIFITKTKTIMKTFFNYKLMFKNITIKNIYLGAKKANEISLLPAKVESLYTSAILRVLRFIGGISILLVITSKYLLFSKELQIIILIWLLFNLF